MTSSLGPSATTWLPPDCRWHPREVDPTFAVGASVYVDPLDDESGGGVVVAWSAHFVLVAAAMDALSEGRAPDDPCIQLAGTASKTMQDAIAEILSVAGYTVAKDSDDMQPFHLLVRSGGSPRRGGSGWTRRRRIARRPLPRRMVSTGHRTKAMQLADSSDSGPPQQRVRCQVRGGAGPGEPEGSTDTVGRGSDRPVPFPAAIRRTAA